MQKTVLTKAVAVALATFGAGAVFAQSSLTLYGNADVSIDNVRKTAGVPLLYGTGGNVGQGTKGTVTRVSPSGTSQTSFGFKGVEDLGNGYKAAFILEGQLSHDTGALSQDGRIFGRQSYVGLTTPFGEVRLGRQYAPIFYSTAFVTAERFGATDLFIEGGASNNLQVRQDNQISYWLKAGGLTASAAYSPNAGSFSLVNGNRGAAASAAAGGILGAAGAGATESTELKTGRAAGLFANYAVNTALNFTAGFHRNEFDGASFSVSGLVSSFKLDRYSSYNFGVKYVMPGSGIVLDAAYGQGKYAFDNAEDIRMDFVAAGTRVPVGGITLVAQVSHSQFRNFTKGKDIGLAFGADYDMSKRTTLYTRFVQIRDKEGDVRPSGLTHPLLGALGIAGGPDVVSTNLGFRETPVFAGAGINPGGKAMYIGAGIRHTF